MDAALKQANLFAYTFMLYYNPEVRVCLDRYKIKKHCKSLPSGKSEDNHTILLFFSPQFDIKN